MTRSRSCAVCGGPTPTGKHTYCARCGPHVAAAKAVARKRPSPTAWGWGAPHQRLRRQLAPMVERGEATCVRCLRPIEPGTPWHLGHLDGGARDEYAGPEHDRQAELDAFQTQIDAARPKWSKGGPVSCPRHELRAQLTAEAADLQADMRDRIAGREELASRWTALDAAWGAIERDGYDPSSPRAPGHLGPFPIRLDGRPTLPVPQPAPARSTSRAPATAA